MWRHKARRLSGPDSSHAALCSLQPPLWTPALHCGKVWADLDTAESCSTLQHCRTCLLVFSLPAIHTNHRPTGHVRRSKFCCFMLFFLVKGNMSCYCQHLKTADSRLKYIFVKCLVTCIVLFKRIFGLFVTNLVLFSQISICVEGINPRFCDVVRRHHIIDSPVQTLHLHLLKSTPSLVVHRHVFRVITKIIHTLPD